MRIVLFVLLLPWPLWAGSVLPLTLQDLKRDANRIFVGECLESVRELDEHQIPSLSIRLAVERPIRGVRQGERLWVKQFAGGACRPGERLLLFLYPESRLGFSSAVGLGQGRFAIRQDSTGRTSVTTPFPHLTLEIQGEDLEGLIRRIRSYAR